MLLGRSQHLSPPASVQNPQKGPEKVRQLITSPVITLLSSSLEAAEEGRLSETRASAEGDAPGCFFAVLRFPRRACVTHRLPTCSCNAPLFSAMASPGAGSCGSSPQDTAAPCQCQCWAESGTCLQRGYGLKGQLVSWPTDRASWFNGERCHVIPCFSLIWGSVGH